MPTVFDLCTPRADIFPGHPRDEDFAADLSKVVRESAPDEYQRADVFFQHTHPTRGLRTLLESVCRRLSDVGGELNSVIRLDTQYGGGKTHSLIALVHAARGMKGVANISEFVDPKLLPRGVVRIAALDGENSDPANGLRLEDGVLARTIWGELAWRLAGRAGFERVRRSDEEHIAPGAETIAELFGGEPTLILIDEVSVYLRKVAKHARDASGQFSAFVQSLIKAVTSTPRVALVTTLAVRAEEQDAVDAYKAEHELAMQSFEEAESIIARKLLQIDPAEEDETIDVLRRRLFERVDVAGAQQVRDQYVAVWERNRDSLPSLTAEARDQFRKGYPLHPETLNVLIRKVSSLSTFQRTRGMLRLLSRTVHHLWTERPADAFAIHPHHIDPGHPPIRQELLTRLGQRVYAPALDADIAAVPGKEPALAQAHDRDHHAGQPPVSSYLARTVFLNTLAFGEAAQGITPEQLRYSVANPVIEPAVVEEARRLFIGESSYLDDRPGSPMRFRVEPNLNQLVQRAMREVDPDELRSELNAQVKSLFSGRSGDFECIAFPGGPYDIPDDVGDGRPRLVVLHYDAFTVSDAFGELPAELVRMATRQGQKEEFRALANNFVFIVAEQRLVSEMKGAIRRRMALERLDQSAKLGDLAEHQQRKLREEREKSRTQIAIAVLQCYRHLFYPNNAPHGSSGVKLGHTTIELHNASDAPGDGQKHLKRALRDQKKLLAREDQPDAPTFVRDQTPLKTKGHLSTAELRAEYRRAPALSILLDDSPLIACIRAGVARDNFVYREGDRVFGNGDPEFAIHLNDNSFVHTMEHATKTGLWPRPAPKPTEPLTGPLAPARPLDPSERSTPTAAGPTIVTDGGTVRSLATFTAEGSLRQALTEIFERARHDRVPALSQLLVKAFDAKATFAVQTAAAALPTAEVRCEYDLSLTADGMDRFVLGFAGTLKQASTVKSLIEPLLRTAKDPHLEGRVTLSFRTQPLPTSAKDSEAFTAQMTRTGAGDCWVEATAAPIEKTEKRS